MQRVLEIILYVAGNNSAPPGQEEKPPEKQLASLDLSLCFRVKAFADELVGSLNLCWPEKLPPSMDILPFAPCLGQ